ncbi:MAG: DNA polymerase III subunit delta' [Dehalococcoidia bacterium]
MPNWNILGQDQLVAALDRSLRQDQLAHAYLLVGQPQTGKSVLARRLAQAVNCLEDDRPCGQCQQCQRIERGFHADIEVIAPARDERTNRMRTEIGIDQVRALERTAILGPYEGRCRVFIIEGAERMSVEAANALLKTLEEPPPQVLLLLLTANLEGLLPTIRSRCQRLDLRPLSEETLLTYLTEERGVALEDARLLAKLSGGRLGWALAAATDPKILDTRQQRLEALQEVVDGGLEQRFQYAQELATQFSRDRATTQEVLGFWLLWWRDLLMLTQGVPELMKNLDWRESLEERAPRYQKDEVTAVVRELVATLERLGQNANARLALDVLMLALPGNVGAGLKPAPTPG